MRGLLACLCLAASVTGGTARAACPEIWSSFLAPGPQVHLIQSAFQTERGPVLEVEFVDLEGDLAKRFGFFAYDGPCIHTAIIVSSYAASQLSRTEGEPRRFFLDLYEGGMHSTLDQFEGEPDVAGIRTLAREILGAVD